MWHKNSENKIFGYLRPREFFAIATTPLLTVLRRSLPSIWQLRHPFKALWMIRKGRVLTSAYEKEQIAESFSYSSPTDSDDKVCVINMNGGMYMINEDCGTVYVIFNTVT